MPPKNKSSGASKKTEQKKKERVIEDKTFGLKNKKGAKQQKFIQQVQKQVTSGGNKSAKQQEKEREEQKKKKEQKKNEIIEMNNILKPVQQIAAKGVDPKSMLCAYFKVGQCAKGNKCKFSHDLTIERRSEKRNAYDDENDTSNDGENKTKIICKFFLDAVEDKKFGWFWECPAGTKCIYKHSLPHGYILKRDRKKMDKDTEEISLEDLIERERAALGANTTKVTLDTFLAWKKKKLKDKEELEIRNTNKKRNDYKSGKDAGLSGREMFSFNPDLAVGEVDMEEGDADFDLRNIKPDLEEGEEDEEHRFQFKEIDFNALLGDYKDVDSSAKLSVAKADRLEALKQELEKQSNGVEIETAAVELEGAVAIDEDLFGGDDEDLDDLEEQLEELAVNS